MICGYVNAAFESTEQPAQGNLALFAVLFIVCCIEVVIVKVVSEATGNRRPQDEDEEETEHIHRHEMEGNEEDVELEEDQEDFIDQLDPEEHLREALQDHHHEVSNVEEPHHELGFLDESISFLDRHEDLAEKFDILTKENNKIHINLLQEEVNTKD